MRIKLTEGQYELLRMINEVVSGFSGAVEKGGYVAVSYMLGEKEEVSILKITNIYGNGQFIEGSNKNGVFLFDLSSAFSKTDNTFTGLKDGKYIPPQKNEEGKIISAPQISGGSKMVLKNVVKIDISNSSKKLVDTVLSDKGEEFANTDNDISNDVEGKTDSEKEQEQEIRKKEIMKMAMADPTIRKMMYYQPSLLGGLIKIGKAKGIAVVNNIINKYGDGDSEKTKKTSKEFLKNKYYEFETVKPVSVTHGLKDFKLDAGVSYRPQFDGEKFNGTIKGLPISYSIKLKKKQDNGTYKAVLEVKFKETGRNTPDRIETKKEDIIVKFNK